MDIVQILNEVNKISEKVNDKIAPVEILKKFDGGRSGALVYMVEYGEDNKVGIVKISKDNEAKVFNKAYDLASKNHMNRYIAKLITNYEVKIYEGNTLYASLYDLAGDDIYNSKTFLDKVLNEEELKDNIISKMTKFIFTWNKEHNKKYLSPKEIIKNELSYRYMDDKYIKAFKDIKVDKNTKWVSLDGTDEILPNPYYYFNDKNIWGEFKITCLTSYAHGDFQGNNIIFTENKPIMIDFCDLVEDCNVFHDLRYLEAITIGDYLEIDTQKDRKLWSKVCDKLSQSMTDVDMPKGKGMSLLRHLMVRLRENVKIVVSDSRNSLYDPSFYLAGVACGLINMRKYVDVNKKKAAFIYAAYNLKTFLKDTAVNMYTPDLNSCMVFNWIDCNKPNSRVVLEKI